jgi:hypothetical protein
VVGERQQLDCNSIMEMNKIESVQVFGRKVISRPGLCVERLRSVGYPVPNRPLSLSLVVWL